MLHVNNYSRIILKSLKFLFQEINVFQRPYEKQRSSRKLPILYN